MTISEVTETRSAAPPTSVLPQQGSAQEMFELYFDHVYRYFSRRVREIEDAEDLAAETFAAVISAKAPKGVEPLCWLYGIARRKLADHLRRQKRRANEPAPAATYPSQAAERLRGLVDRLPERQREALLLQGVDGLPVNEIAQVMGCSRTSVKALLQRAKDRLRLQSKGEFDPR